MCSGNPLQGPCSGDWTDIGAGTVMKVPLGGGTPTTLASGGAAANGMAVDATNVYWTDAVTHAVMKVPIGGGAMTTVATGDQPPFGIALDATNVYWTVPNDGAVLMLPK
jgi:sugar lactone lactonase YvrE